MADPAHTYIGQVGQYAQRDINVYGPQYFGYPLGTTSIKKQRVVAQLSPIDFEKHSDFLNAQIIDEKAREEALSILNKVETIHKTLQGKIVQYNKGGLNPKPLIEEIDKVLKIADALKNSDKPSIPADLLRPLFSPFESLNEQLKPIARLKKHYLERSTIPIFTTQVKGKWELSFPIDSLYTTLAMITEEEKKEKREEAVIDKRRPTHETIFKAKKEVSPSEIFSQKKIKDAPRKRVLIFGSAGIGKTVFLNYVTHKWAKGELWPEFQTLLLIPLRNLNKQFYPPKDTTYGAHDILNRECQHMGIDFSTFLKDKDLLKNALVILDGADELPVEVKNERHHLYDAYNKLKETFPNILMTSRPGAVSFDRNIEFEILGFNDRQITDYIHSVFSELEKKELIPKDSHKKKTLEMGDYLKMTPLAHSLAHIPINLSIMCSLFSDDPASFNPKAPMTMTALYNRIINHFHKMFLLRLGEDKTQVLKAKRLYNDERVASIQGKLAKLAFEATVEDNIYIDEEKIADAIGEVGEVPTLVKHLGLFKIEGEKGCFIHLTFQEYFAASYLVNLYKSGGRAQAQEIVRNSKFMGRYDLVLQMTAGQLSLRAPKYLQAFFDDLFAEPYDLALSYELGLIARCFEECQSPGLIKQYASFVNGCRDYLETAPLRSLKIDLLNGNPNLLKHEIISNLLIHELQDAKKGAETAKVLRTLISNAQTLPIEILQALITQSKKSSDCWTLRDIAVAGGEFVPQALKTLISMTDDTKLDKGARAKAAYSLGEIAKAGGELPPQALEVLISMVGDTKLHWYTRGSLASALGKIAKAGRELPPQALEVLISMVGDTELYGHARGKAAGSLGKIAKAGGELPPQALEVLISMVGDTKLNGGVRERAAYALGEVARAGVELEPQATQTLIKMAGDTKLHEYVRGRSAVVLGEIAKAGRKLPPQAIDALISMAGDTQLDEYARREAAEALGEIAKAEGELAPKALEVLIKIAGDAKLDEGVRGRAAYALGEIAKAGRKLPPQAIDALISLAGDTQLDEYARREAAEALGEIAKSEGELAPKALDALISMVSDTKLGVDVPVEAFGALEEIAKAGREVPPQAITALIRMVSNTKLGGLARGLAALTLKEIAMVGVELSSQALEVLINMASDTELFWNDRAWAASALGEIAKAGGKLLPKALGVLISMASDTKLEGYACGESASALGEIAKAGRKLPPQAIDALISMAVDTQLDEKARGKVAAALREIAEAGGELPPQAIDALNSMASDTKLGGYASGSAAEALGKIAKTGEELSSQAIKALISMAGDTQLDMYVRRKVASALGEIAKAGGELSSQALKALNSMAGDKNLFGFNLEEAVEPIGSISIKLLAGIASQDPKSVFEACYLTRRGFCYSEGKVFLTDGKQTESIEGIDLTDPRFVQLIDRAKHIRGIRGS